MYYSSMKKINLLQKIAALLLPPICVHCKKEWAYICTSCMKSIETYTVCCFYCKNLTWRHAVCNKCRITSNFKSVIVNFCYSWTIKAAIRTLKYQWYKVISKTLIKKASYCNDLSYFEPSETILTYVPMHRRKKYWIRWYNQAELLAYELWKQTGLKVLAICKKNKRTKSQTHFTRQKRKKNVYNSFTLSNTIPNNVKCIIIVDDVITTWATLTAIAALIKQQYPNIALHAYCLARH